MSVFVQHGQVRTTYYTKTSLPFLLCKQRSKYGLLFKVMRRLPTAIFNLKADYLQSYYYPNMGGSMSLACPELVS